MSRENNEEKIQQGHSKVLRMFGAISHTINAGRPQHARNDRLSQKRMFQDYLEVFGKKIRTCTCWTAQKQSPPKASETSTITDKERMFTPKARLSRTEEACGCRSNVQSRGWGVAFLQTSLQS